MSSPRVKGNALSLLVDGIDYWTDASRVKLDGQTMELPLMCGGTQTLQLRSWFDVEAVQSTAIGSLWRLILDNPNRDVPFGYAPHGNAVPTEDEPHFTGILTLPGGRPALGGAAGIRTEQTFSVRLHIVQGPLRVTTP